MSKLYITLFLYLFLTPVMAATSNTKGHYKSNGINLTIEYPDSWKKQESKNPLIIQTFESTKLSSCMLQVKPIETTYSRQDWQKEFDAFDTPDMTDFGNVVFTKRTTYNNEPGMLVISTRPTKINDFTIYSRYLTHLFGYKNSLVSIICIAGGLTQTDADNLFEQNKSNFIQIGNSVVFNPPSTNAWSEIKTFEVDGTGYTILTSDNEINIQTSTTILPHELNLDTIVDLIDIGKFIEFIKSNDRNMLEQASGAYSFLEAQKLRFDKWCEPHYPLTILPNQIKTTFSKQKKYASTILKSAFGDTWETIIEQTHKKTENKIIQQAERDYQLMKELLSEYEDLTKREYCEILDQSSKPIINHYDKLFQKIYPLIYNIPTSQDIFWKNYNSLAPYRIQKL